MINSSDKGTDILFEITIHNKQSKSAIHYEYKYPSRKVEAAPCSTHADYFLQETQLSNHCLLIKKPLLETDSV